MSILLLIVPLLSASVPAMVPVAPDERVAVLDVGAADAPAAVLVPGLSGCGWGYRNLQDRLAGQGWRVLVVAPLGVGLSDRTPGADYTLTAQAQRLARVLDARGVTGAVVVAQGVAASMALRLALARPELVRGVVSIEGGAAEAAATATVRRSLQLAGMVSRLGGATLLRDRFGENLRAASGDPGWVDRSAVRRYFRGTGRDIEGTLAAFRAMSEQQEPQLLGPRLPELDIPVVLLQGDAPHDGGLSDAQVARLRAGLRDLQVRVVPGAGHFIHEEQPQAVLEAVTGLGTRLAAAPPQRAGRTSNQPTTR